MVSRSTVFIEQQMEQKCCLWRADTFYLAMVHMKPFYQNLHLVHAAAAIQSEKQSKRISI